MPLLADYVLDAGLAKLDDATHIYICSAEPATYAEATSTYALGNKATPSIGAVGDRTGGGRKRTVASFTDGSVTGTGTAAAYAIVDSVNSRVLAADALSASQGVTSGNTFSLPAFDIGIPDAV